MFKNAKVRSERREKQKQPKKKEAVLADERGEPMSSTASHQQDQQRDTEAGVPLTVSCVSFSLCPICSGPGMQLSAGPDREGRGNCLACRGISAECRRKGEANRTGLGKRVAWGMPQRERGRETKVMGGGHPRPFPPFSRPPSHVSGGTRR